PFRARARSGCMRLLAIALFSTACATQHVNPDDQSAEAHRAQAAREQAEAEQHQQQFDPSQERSGGGRGRVGGELVFASYNPTAWHLHEASTLGAHARAHEAAAVALEKFEADECRMFSPKVRAACPVAGPIQRVEEIPGGVRYVIAADAPVDAVVAH